MIDICHNCLGGAIELSGRSLIVGGVWPSVSDGEFLLSQVLGKRTFVLDANLKWCSENVFTPCLKTTAIHSRTIRLMKPNRRHADVNFIDLTSGANLQNRVPQSVFGEKRPFKGKISKYRYETIQGFLSLGVLTKFSGKRQSGSDQTGAWYLTQKKFSAPLSVAPTATSRKILQCLSFPTPPHPTAKFHPNPYSFYRASA